MMNDPSPILAWSRSLDPAPPFDAIRVADFEPAFAETIAERRAAAERVASDPHEPTTANTLEPLERSGRPLRRLSRAFRAWNNTMNTPDLQAVDREISVRLAALDDDLVQNDALFARIEQVWRGAGGDAAITPEQKRLAWLYHGRFVRSGARVPPATRPRLRAINARLAELYTTFRANLLADEQHHFLHLLRDGDLAGVPDTVRAEAREAARSRGLDGWVIENNRTAVEAFLGFAEGRELRRRAWEMFTARGSQPGETDNRPVVQEILGLRAERAALLGYASHAHLRLEDAVAGSPERALALLERVLDKAVPRVREELAEMSTLARAEGLEEPLEPWDHAFYGEKARRRRFDLDQAAVRCYLQLDRLVEGMFWLAGELFGLRFSPIDGAPVYHPDVRVWRVEQVGGEPLGTLYLDPFARPGKRSGAWMDLLVNQERLDGVVRPLVTNVCNFPHPPPGKHALLSWSDARTLFHEFGHALHGLASTVTYPSLSGTEVPRDFVEFPSQLLERWQRAPELLASFALHVETGERIPPDLVERLERSNDFNQGLATLAYLATAFVDLRLHLGGEVPEDLRRFELETLAAAGIPSEVPMLHRLPHFHHGFGGESYSASYYSYIWADAMAADAIEAFTEAGGLYDREVARRVWEEVLAVGNSRDPLEAYRRFRGRDPDPGALLRKRGFG
jgi:peptidyl-dipeptidase Dcp